VTENLIEPTIGQIVTPITWDGANFHPPMSTVAGLLQVSIEAATEIVTRCMGYDGGAWVALHVNAAGNLQTDILSSALPVGAATEATLADLHVDVDSSALPVGAATEATLAALHVDVDSSALPVGAATEATLAALHVDVDSSALPVGAATEATLANLHVDVDSLRGQTDVIPMNYHSQWRKRYSRVVDAGQDYVDSIVVPVGLVAVVTNLNMWTNNAGTTVVIASVRDGVDTTFAYRDGAPAANVPYGWTGFLYLNAGDYIRFDPTGCPIGGTVYGDVSAYYMRIP